MTESDFQSRFTKWAKHNLHESCACELKICKGTSLPFNRLEEHQEIALKMVQEKVLMYKIPDVGYDQKPFDFFALSGKAYVVILFYQKRGDNEFYMIDILRWIDYRDSSKKKSLTKGEAYSMAERVERLL